jgi:hypothetical protein
MLLPPKRMRDELFSLQPYEVHRLFPARLQADQAHSPSLPQAPCKRITKPSVGDKKHMHVPSCKQPIETCTTNTDSE